MALGLVLCVLHVGMDQTENEERIEEKIQADGCRHKRYKARANQDAFI